jgi:ubiquinone/menaquinone biosynthesis C-methylase UbiE
MTAEFQDHFSARAVGYAAYRPSYPAGLFGWLAEASPREDVAWDCATGSGQAALGLAPYFRRIVATDASPAQLEHAKAASNIEYRMATAESSGLGDQSVDLVTVAQALHWFDRHRFFNEARRVLRPGGVLACWMYNRMRVSTDFDRLVGYLYTDIVGPFWPGDRVLVDQDYRTIELPFPELAPPRFEMTEQWSFQHVVGYLRTWSAVTRYLQAKGHDPVALVEPELLAAWGNPDQTRSVCWPLVVRVARPS